MESYCYCDGRIMPLSEARVHPCDLGYTRGYAVFDVIPVKKGRLISVHEHWDRLKRSAEELLMNVPIKEEEWVRNIHALYEKSQKENISVRTIISGGPSEDGLSIEKESMIMLVEMCKPYAEELYTDGIKVITQEFQRQNPAIKTTSYIFPVRLQQEKKRVGAFEILYVLNGKILEASTSNFFLIKEDVLVTPAHNVIWGTTRNKVIQLARENSMQVEERDIIFEELFECSEAFLTASSKNVMPVVQVDEIKIGIGEVGDVTKRMMALYKDCVDTQR